jgi:RES domain-containing protein
MNQNVFGPRNVICSPASLASQSATPPKRRACPYRPLTANPAPPPSCRGAAGADGEILHRVTGWAGGGRQALAWYRAEPIPAFGGRLSTSANGAVAEVTQGFAHKFHPLTLCSFKADCAGIVALSTDTARAAAGVSLEDMACARMDGISSDRKPASWALHARFGKTAAGLLVPSFAHGAAPGTADFTLWHWGSGLPRRVTVFDPQNMLKGR